MFSWSARKGDDSKPSRKCRAEQTTDLEHSDLPVYSRRILGLTESVSETENLCVLPMLQIADQLFRSFWGRAP